MRKAEERPEQSTALMRILICRRKQTKRICNGITVVVMKWILEEKVKATELLMK